MDDSGSAITKDDVCLANVIDNLPGYIFRRVVKSDGSIEAPYFGALVRNIMGIGKDTVVTPDEFYRHVHADDRDRLSQAIALCGRELSPFDEEFRLVSTKGRVYWFHSVAPARQAANGDVVWDGFARDITAEKAVAARLQFLACHDPLTGLSNRSHFKDTLSKAVGEPQSVQDPVGVAVLDIDSFREINETIGEDLGDKVLCEVARRIEPFACGDGTVARIGGDEFALLLRAGPELGSLVSCAETICDDIARPMQISGHEIVVQACVGVTMSETPSDIGEDAAAVASAELLQQADLALQAAKQDGPGKHRPYAAHINSLRRKRTAGRNALRNAIAEKQFELHYHPLVDLQGGGVIGAEALVRWNCPQLGPRRPDSFIPLAEESGLIVPLGAWIMYDAMRQARDWRQAGIAVPRIAINVSSVQIQKPGFMSMIEEALKDTGSEPSDFELELTESVLIEASPQILNLLSALKSLGFRLVIDDFGTGHSTFKYLRDFVVDKIKIDQTFIRNLTLGTSDAIIVRAMIALAHSLGFEIVAEGIETITQREFLLSEGCTIGQGYLFSLPLTIGQFGAILKDGVMLPVL
jgi:diguanylate cyclase (GGDEF)-like protein